MTAHRIGYCRTSTDHQTQQLQLDALAGCDRIFTETVSGAKRVEDRPELANALDHLRPGDQLVVWRLDRLSRSLPELLRIVAILEAKGADFASLTENLETRSPGGKLIFHIFGALAEWEREVIRGRVRAGMDSYIKKNGSMPGRPSVVTNSKLEVASQLISDGRTVNEVCATVGISRSTLYRHLRTSIVLRRQGAPRLVSTKPVSRQPGSIIVPIALSAEVLENCGASLPRMERGPSCGWFDRSWSRLAPLGRLLA